MEMEEDMETDIYMGLTVLPVVMMALDEKEKEKEIGKGMELEKERERDIGVASGGVGLIG